MRIFRFVDFFSKKKDEPESPKTLRPNRAVYDFYRFLGEECEFEVSEVPCRDVREAQLELAFNNAS